MYNFLSTQIITYNSLETAQIYLELNLTNLVILYLIEHSMSNVRDKIGGRPFEVKKSGTDFIISFYPMTTNAKNPDAVLFRLTLTSADLKKLVKMCS